MPWILPMALAAALTTTRHGVDPDAGTFHGDILDVDGPIRIERTWQSGSDFPSMFGRGWGCDWEVYLEVSGDGSVVVHEYGGGGLDRYAPVSYGAESDASARDEAEQIAGAAARAKALVDADRPAYVERLVRDAMARHNEWAKYRKQGLLPAVDLPVGTTLANRHGAFLLKTKEGFARGQQKFDDQGLLVADGDRKVVWTTGKTHRIAHIDDAAGHSVAFTFDEKGRATQIGDATFEYDANGLLARSRSAAGEVDYAWTTDGRPKLSRLTFADGTDEEIGYYWGAPPADQVRTFRKRDGSVELYTYAGRAHAAKYRTTVEKLGTDGALVSTVSWEYEIGARADGERYTKAITQTTDGKSVRRELNEQGLVVKVVGPDGDEVAYGYDANERPVSATTKDRVVKLTYDGQGRVARAEDSANGAYELKYGGGSPRVISFEKQAAPDGEIETINSVYGDATNAPAMTPTTAK